MFCVFCAGQVHVQVHKYVYCQKLDADGVLTDLMGSQ